MTFTLDSSFILQFPPHKRIFWVGAGVSFPSPCSLPLATDLFDFVLEEVCGRNVCQKALTAWTAASQLLGSFESSFFLPPRPRLEALLGEVEQVSLKKAKNLRFSPLRGFKSFTTSSPNDNHVLLAKALLDGSHIVTTNFDLGLEQAVRTITGGRLILHRAVESGVVTYSAPGRAGLGRLYHVHGDAHDIRTIVATVRRLVRGLPNSLAEMLHRRFHRGCALIFVGYGAGDAFDILPFFRNLPRLRKSVALFVQHPPGPVPHSAHALLQPFGTSAVAVMDTHTALTVLSKGAVISAPTNDRPKRQWDTEFRSRMILDDFRVLQPFIVCKVANLFGMNASLLSRGVAPRALKLEHSYDSKDLFNTLAATFRLQNRRKKEAVVQGRVSDLLGFYSAHRKYKDAAYLSGTPARLLAHCRMIAKDGDQRISWRPFVRLSLHTHMRLARPRKLGRTDIRHHQELRILLDAAGLLAQIPLSRLVHLHAHAVALRNRALLDAAINGVRRNDLWDQVFFTYRETASIAGFAGAFRDRALASHILSRRRGRSATRLWAERAYRLAALVGDHRGTRLALGLLDALS
jgi:hypothetical protein